MESFHSQGDYSLVSMETRSQRESLQSKMIYSELKMYYFTHTSSNLVCMHKSVHVDKTHQCCNGFTVHISQHYIQIDNVYRITLNF